MSLPETCPFCGTDPHTTASGNQCRGGDRWVLFSCGTSIYAAKDLRRTQSRKCEDAERARLAARFAELEARCKRLEEAGDAMADWNMNERNLGCDPELAHRWQQAKEAKQ